MSQEGLTDYFFKVNIIYIVYISAFMSPIYGPILWNKVLLPYGRVIIYTIVSKYVAKLIDFQECTRPCSIRIWF